MYLFNQWTKGCHRLGSGLSVFLLKTLIWGLVAHSKTSTRLYNSPQVPFPTSSMTFPISLIPLFLQHARCISSRISVPVAVSLDSSFLSYLQLIASSLRLYSIDLIPSLKITMNILAALAFHVVQNLYPIIPRLIV